MRCDGCVTCDGLWPIISTINNIFPPGNNLKRISHASLASRRNVSQHHVLWNMQFVGGLDAR
jgi:hypothetical protein